jgi:hypothetical protein
MPCTPAWRFACALALLAYAAPLGARADDRQAFHNDTRRMLHMHSFRMRLIELSPQGMMAREMTFVAPDKLRVQIAASPMVAVLIGTNVWIRAADGTWKKSADRLPGDPLAAIHDTFTFATDLQGRTVRFIGTRREAGVASHVYEIDAPKKPGYTAEAARIWIGVADGYPRRIERRNGPFASTAIYSDWNKPLTVSAS